MDLFIFKVLPLLSVASLAAGIFFTARGVTRGNGRQRALGMGFVALFVVLLAVFALLGLARL